MSVTVSMPQLGETVTEGTILKWAKAVGDTIAEDEVLLEISTDKVDTEVPSPAAGTILDILVPEGETVEVGAQLCVIGDAAEQPASAPTPPVEAPAAEAPATQPPASVPAAPVEAAAAPAMLPPAAVPSEPVPAPPPIDTPAAPPAPEPAIASATPLPTAPAVDIGVLSPVVRKLATEHGVDLTQVAGTGCGGRITRKDVQAFIDGGLVAAAAAPAAEPVSAPVADEPAAASEPIPALVATEPALEEPVVSEPAVVESDAVAAPAAAEPAAPEPPASEPIPALVATEPALEEPVVPEPAVVESDAVAAPAAAEPAAPEPPAAEPVPAAPAAEPVAAEPAVAEPPAAEPVPAARPEPAPAPEPEPVPAAAAAPDPAASEPAAASVGGDQDIPLDRLRVRIAENMIKAKQTAAHVWTSVEVDYEAVEQVRRRHKEAWKAREGFSLTYLPFLARATIDALNAYPVVNSSFHLDEGKRVQHAQVGLGVAVDLDQQGLIVMTIRGADGLSLRGLAREVRRVADKARSGNIEPDDVVGSSFTITNPGPFGSFMSAPIINVPNVGILSTDTVTKRPTVIAQSDGTDALAIHHIGYLGLTWDHRAFDGSTAVLFLRRIKDAIENWDWEHELS